MKEVPIGAKGQFALVVEAEHRADRFKDTTLPAVLATPVMIMVMENAALNAIKPYLDPGESAVGTRVEIRHMAPTPIGLNIVGEAEVTRVQELYLEGKKQEAAAAVPTAMVEDVYLVGPKEKIRDDLAAWRESMVTTMIVAGDPDLLRTMAELVLGG